MSVSSISPSPSPPSPPPPAAAAPPSPTTGKTPAAGDASPSNATDSAMPLPPVQAAKTPGTGQKVDVMV